MVKIVEEYGKEATKIDEIDHPEEVKQMPKPLNLEAFVVVLYGVHNMLKALQHCLWMTNMGKIHKIVRTQILAIRKLSATVTFLFYLLQWYSNS